jgi:hypothetical protein
MEWNKRQKEWRGRNGWLGWLGKALFFYCVSVFICGEDGGEDWKKSTYEVMIH